MAAKTPVTNNTTAGYVVPGKGLFGGVATATNNLKTDVDQHLSDRNGLAETIFFFSDIDDGDTWTSNIPGIVAVAWQPADSSDDLVGPTLTNAATGEITFQAANSNSEGWLWVKHGG